MGSKARLCSGHLFRLKLALGTSGAQILFLLPINYYCLTLQPRINLLVFNPWYKMFCLLCLIWGMPSLTTIQNSLPNMRQWSLWHKIFCFWNRRTTVIILFMTGVNFSWNCLMVSYKVPWAWSRAKYYVTLFKKTGKIICSCLDMMITISTWCG